MPFFTDFFVDTLNYSLIPPRAPDALTGGADLNRALIVARPSSVQASLLGRCPPPINAGLSVTSCSDVRTLQRRSWCRALLGKLKEWSPQIQEMGELLRKVGDKLDSDVDLQRLIDRVYSAPRDVFFRVAKEMFADGKLSWGRVVTFLYFCGKVIIKVRHTAPPAAGRCHCSLITLIAPPAAGRCHCSLLYRSHSAPSGRAVSLQPIIMIP
ncbi:uncharacterized protein LOC116652624 [Coturnix japonica]|uniref:uncharacterized protein LOC116652624 n=1 Tax=Coturnix japonica TaxID=93934 RepID=UPI0013A5CC8A|nr:uncharacterized protein LOC116652624 [Coturnix japonica]